MSTATAANFVETPTAAAASSPPPAGEPKPQERRRQPRQTLVTKALLMPEQLPGGPRRIFVSNITMLGLGFRAPQPFELGERYKIIIEAGPMRMSTHMEIRNCRQRPDQSFDVGGQFVMSHLNVDQPFRRAASIPRNPSRDLIARSD